ncbi:MAG: bL21 family ribosomal protein [Acidimicrobiales bacterium]
MYAVIKTGGKQYRVSEGDRLDVELLSGPTGRLAEGETVSFETLLVAGGPVAGGPVAGGPVAGGPVAGGPVAGSSSAGGPSVDGPTVLVGGDAPATRGRIVGESKGPKVKGFTYKAKTRARRRFGHRQHYTTVEITSVGHAADGAPAGAGGAAAGAEPAVAGAGPGGETVGAR